MSVVPSPREPMNGLWIPEPPPAWLLLPPGMERRWSEDERDGLLLGAFSRLAPRIAPSAWTTSSAPFSELSRECEALGAREPLRSHVADYMARKPAALDAAQMLFTMIAMSARARWQDAPPQHRGTAARGWFLGRWIPTFLIIDGPIGRFLDDSPLARVTDAPLLLGARQFLKEESFYALRNGFAHWSFSWDVADGESFLVVRSREKQKGSLRVSRAEADAFHLVAFALVQILYANFLAPDVVREAEPESGSPAA